MLECEERNSQRQDDLEYLDIETEQELDITNKEIEIFEDKQQAEIERHAADKQKAPLSRRTIMRGKRPAHEIIDDDCSKQQEQVPPLSIPVEKRGRQQQPNLDGILLSGTSEQQSNNQHDRQKIGEKRDRIEQHGAVSPL